MPAKLVLLLIASVALLVSCGGTDGTPTADDYFRDLVAANDKIESPAQTQVANLSGALRTGSDKELISAYQEYFAQAIPLTRSYYQSLQKLDPPADIEESHNEYTDSLGDLVTLYESISSRLQRATTRAELAEAMSQDRINLAFLRGSRACHALQDLADRKGIQADLLCEAAAQPTPLPGQLSLQQNELRQ